MLSEQEKKFVFSTSVVSLVIAFVVCIPFSVSKFTNVEFVLKYIVAPIIIGILTILNMSVKYRTYRPAYRFGTVCSFVPLFSYSSAVLVNVLTILGRSTQVFTGGNWLGMILCFTVILFAIVIFSHFYSKIVVIFSKNEAIFLDAIFFVAMIIDTCFLGYVAKKHIALQALTGGNVLFIVLIVLIGLALVVLHSFSLRKLKIEDSEYKVFDKQELYKKWIGEREEIYAKSEVEILDGLYNFSKDQLGIEDNKFTRSEEEYGKQSEEIETLKVSIHKLEEQIDYKNCEVEDLKEHENANSKNISLLESQIEQLKKQLLKTRDELKKVNFVRLEEQGDSKSLEKEYQDLHQEFEDYKKATDVTRLHKSVVDELEKTVNVNYQKALQKETAYNLDKAATYKAVDARVNELATDLTKQKAMLLKACEQEKADATASAANLRKAYAQEALELAKNQSVVVQPVVEEKPKAPKVKKVIVPSYDQMVMYARSFDVEGLRCVANATETGHKFYVGKVLYLVTQTTSNDYRITFTASEQDILSMLLAHPTDIQVAKSPKGHWLKLTNKGELTEDFMKDIIRGSLQAVQDAEQSKIDAKVAEKQAKLASKLAEKQSEQLEKEQARKVEAEAKQKAKAKADEAKAQAKALEKAKADEAKAKEKAKAKAEADKLKAKEKAKVAAEKEKAKEKAKAAAEKEKAKAKAKAAAEKEKEKAKKTVSKPVKKVEKPVEKKA